jgi:hypothetical protein
MFMKRLSEDYDRYSTPQFIDINMPSASALHPQYVAPKLLIFARWDMTCKSMTLGPCILQIA